MEFTPFPKIARLFRDVVITEKIDGTNAAVQVSDDGTTLIAQSRTRIITPANDNFGFARWVEANQAELLRLGPGTHFGEWYGSGIQRTYGLKEKRFALFNTARWHNPETRPTCCGVVPVLYEGPFTTQIVTDMLETQRQVGSHAVPGFMNPEGIVVFHTASNSMFKVTLENDGVPKGLTNV